MQVKMLAEMRVEINNISTVIYQSGESYDVEDETALEWKEAGVAEIIGDGEMSSFTPDERAALKHVAAEVLQNAAQAELTLDDLDFDGLKEVAANLELENFEVLGEDELRTALVAHFEAFEAEPEDADAEDELVNTDTDTDVAEDELQLADLSYDELVELAQKAGIEKPRSIKKAELLVLLSEKANAPDTAPETNSEAAE